MCGVFLKMENDIEWIKKRFGVRTSGAKSEPVIFLYVIWFNLICAVFFHILWKSSVCSGTSCSIDLILFTSCISDSAFYAEVWFSGTSLFPSTLIILSIPWIKTNFFCRIKNGFLLFLTLWDTCESIDSKGFEIKTSKVEGALMFLHVPTWSWLMSYTSECAVWRFRYFL